ncbi:hypothetical protein NC651_027979 [Populus alba x Populus x berolinensis]|nr:hypothetical protein NC651_027979 [Populus alba x Populus x berolinensis]
MQFWLQNQTSIAMLERVLSFMPCSSLRSTTFLGLVAPDRNGNMYNRRSIRGGKGHKRIGKYVPDR